jgi:hypothetical protein
MAINYKERYEHYKGIGNQKLADYFYGLWQQNSGSTSAGGTGSVGTTGSNINTGKTNASGNVSISGEPANIIPSIKNTGGQVAGTQGNVAQTGKTGGTSLDPLTYTDPTIQKFKSDFSTAQSKNDIQGMITAAKGADDYRVSLGMSPINTEYIKTLQDKLPTNTNLENANEITMYDKNGNPFKAPASEKSWLISQGYTDVVPGTAGNTGATFGKTDVTNAEETTQQVADFYSKLNDLIQNFGSNFQASETLNEYAARMKEEIDRLLEQRKSEGTAAIEKSRGDITTEASIQSRALDEAYQKQLDELEAKANEIRNAYAAGKRGVETTKTETLPEYQSQRSQADVQAQQAAKNIIDYFKRRGLGTGGQAAAAVAETAQQGLSTQAGINAEESKFLRDISNQMSTLEEQQATGLSDVERMKGEAGGELTSGKRNIIERVQNSLAGLSIDEKNLLDELSRTREEMESEIETQYKDMTQEEKNNAFNQLIAQAGFGLQAADAVRQLVDDIVKLRTENEDREWAKSADNPAVQAQILDNKIKQLQLDNLPEEYRLKFEQLEREISQIGASNLTEDEKEYNRIKLETAKKELQLLKDEGKVTYKNYIDMGREMLDKGFKGYDYTTGNDIWISAADPQKVYEWAIGLPVGEGLAFATEEDLLRFIQDLGLTQYIP